MKRYKKVVQTVLTFPHFLSWVIVASIAINVLSYDGLLNSLILSFGGETVVYRNAKLFKPFCCILRRTGNPLGGAPSSIWQRFRELIWTSMKQRIWTELRIPENLRITLPNILPTISVMFVLQMGNMMSEGLIRF